MEDARQEFAEPSVGVGSATAEQFRHLVDSVRDYAIFLLDPDGYVRTWNPGAERFKGYAADEIIGKHFSRFYTEEDRAAGKPERELEIARREGRIEDEGWRVRKDGSRFWANVVITALRDEETGELIGFAKVTRDLTGRREAEERARRLAREEARREKAERRVTQLSTWLAEAGVQKERAVSRLDAVLRQMPIGVMIVEADGTYSFVNEAAVRMLGGPRVGAKLGNHRAFTGYRAGGSRLEPEDWPHTRALRTGELTVGEEITVRTADGRTLSVAIHAAPIRNESGAITAAVAAFQDITPQQQAREIAERQAIFREQFIGILGHDLRNPLAAVIGSAALLLRQGLPEKHARLVGRILSSAERMERMIADLLDLTRSRLGGGIPIERRSVDLRGVCHRVLDEMEATHPEVEFRLIVTGNTWGDFDPDRIAQVLSNLVGNAISYGTPGGPVSICLREAEDPRTLLLSVHNEGPPIPEEIRPSLFDPFRRGAHRERSTSRGLGLGLYIANQIALAHGGSIEVESTAEGGTTFTVRLPRRAADL